MLTEKTGFQIENQIYNQNPPPKKLLFGTSTWTTIIFIWKRKIYFNNEQKCFWHILIKSKCQTSTRIFSKTQLIKSCWNFYHPWLAQQTNQLTITETITRRKNNNVSLALNWEKKLTGSTFVIFLDISFGWNAHNQKKKKLLSWGIRYLITIQCT